VLIVCVLTMRTLIRCTLIVSSRIVSIKIVSVLIIGGRMMRVRRIEAPGRALAWSEMVRTPHNQFFFTTLHYTPPMHLSVFRDLPVTARELKATPDALERIYENAKLGLRGDALALAAGMLPVELARLKLMDPIAELAEMKGRADSEMTMSRTLYEAAEAGDSKAALEFLRHRHDWVAKQQVQVDVTQSISITAALEMAEKRVKAAQAIEDAVEIVKPLARGLPVTALPEIVDGPV
jgi:hypothetical protein